MSNPLVAAYRYTSNNWAQISASGDRSGYPINAQFLGQMNEAWFQKTLIRAAPPKA